MMKIPLNSRRRRGFALMLVVVQMTLLIALWGVAYRQLGSTMRLIAAMPGTNPAVSDGYKPMALALALLETGDPPANGQTYSCSILTPSGPTYFLVTFLSTSDNPNPDNSRNEKWTVSSQQIAQGDAGGWPTLPSSFGP
jgi:hypothetical protein